jgi:cell division protein ZapE
LTTHPTPASAATLHELYESESARLGYVSDPAQAAIVARLESVRSALLAPRPKEGLLQSLIRKKSAPVGMRGLYIHGGVGRGKTWLMDLFFQSLPFKDKQRSHFHRFMQFVHDELRKHSDESDPLERVADKVAKRARVLCFDELFVADIADAMLLGTLFKALFARGVTLIATSNVAPDDLYKDGLQRARFLPAIRAIKEHCEVIHMAVGTDYRLRLLERATTWYDCSHSEGTAALETLFVEVAGEPGVADSTLALNHRRLKTRRQADDAVWFTFKELCDGPRGQADYIELARCYHTVFLSEVPVLTIEHENQARRFISLVDEFYDRAVKLIICAAAPVDSLYQGKKLRFEFERTRSRLIEMQSQQYLAREHKA